MRIQMPVAVLALCASLVSHAADKSSVAATAALQSMMQSSSLDVPGVLPWHWKMDVILYDADGKTQQNANLEVWYADGNMRTSMTLGADHLTLLRVGDALYGDNDISDAFVPLQIALMEATHPIPDTLVSSTVNLKLTARKVGQIKLNCVEPVFVLPEANTFTMDAQLSFCRTDDTSQFVAHYQPNQNSVLRRRIGKFQEREVPIELELNAFGKRRVSVTTKTLETFTPTADIFDPGSALQPLPLVITVPQPLQLVGLMLNKEAPHYPADAKSRHAEGTVTFDATIDTDGRITSTTLTSKSDPALIDAAKDALTHWIYRPFLINGKAVIVKTTITLHFNLA